MNIARAALILMASLTGINMATYGTRRAPAFSSLAWDCSPTPSRFRSTAARHHIQHAQQPTARLPETCIPMPTMVQRQYFLAHNDMRPAIFARSRSTNSMMQQLFMTSNDDGNGSSDEENTRTSFNVEVLKKETTRLALRTLKKIGKASTRLRAAEEQYDKLRGAIDSSDGEINEELLQQLERAPNVQQYQDELKELQDRLQKMNWLEEQFGKSPLKSKKTLSVEHMQNLIPEGDQVVQYLQELDISDDESQKQKKIEQDARNRRSKKERAAQLKEEGNDQQQGGSRLPYRRYYTEGRIEIRVGKQATDNDVLSLSPEHRSGSHWWYHASGCPGSHVVLCTDASSPSEEDILDAASLAALKSKCIGQSVIKVSMTRARNVSKPRGAKPGLVQLNGDVKTITLKKSEAEKRCQRLEETVIVN